MSHLPTVQSDPRGVAVSGGDTVNIYGWHSRRVKLVKLEVFLAVAATVGTYTLAFTKDPNGTATNMLSAATFDLTTLVVYTPTEVTLSATAADLILNAGDVWRAQFVSSDAGLDAEGVHIIPTWRVL